MVNRIREVKRPSDRKIIRKRAEQPQAAFVAMPPVVGNADVFAWQQALYRRAFEEAQRVVRPSWLERDVLGVWN